MSTIMLFNKSPVLVTLQKLFFNLCIMNTIRLTKVMKGIAHIKVIQCGRMLETVWLYHWLVRKRLLHSMLSLVVCLLFEWSYILQREIMIQNTISMSGSYWLTETEMISTMAKQNPFCFKKFMWSGLVYIAQYSHGNYIYIIMNCGSSYSHRNFHMHTTLWRTSWKLFHKTKSWNAARNSLADGWTKDLLLMGSCWWRSYVVAVIVCVSVDDLDEMRSRKLQLIQIHK